MYKLIHLNHSRYKLLSFNLQKIFRTKIPFLLAFYFRFFMTMNAGHPTSVSTRKLDVVCKSNTSNFRNLRISELFQINRKFVWNTQILKFICHFVCAINFFEKIHKLFFIISWRFALFFVKNFQYKNKSFLHQSYM